MLTLAAGYIDEVLPKSPGHQARRLARVRESSRLESRGEKQKRQSPELQTFHESRNELDVQLLTTILTTTSTDPASWQLSMAPKIQFLSSRYCNAIPKHGCKDGNGSAFVRFGMSRYCPTDLVPYISLPSASLVINSLRSLPSTISRAILQPLYVTTSSPGSGCACTGPES